jgi:transcriptional regulator with XRE-family HTH domain
MDSREMSGAKLALASGLSQNYLAKRLRDELAFTLNDVERIAGALGVDCSVLAAETAIAYERAKSREQHAVQHQ